MVSPLLAITTAAACHFALPLRIRRTSPANPRIALADPLLMFAVRGRCASKRACKLGCGGECRIDWVDPARQSRGDLLRRSKLQHITEPGAHFQPEGSSARVGGPETTK